MIEIGQATLVLTHDTMSEGTHFRADADMSDVAWKLAASNLSDLAAKGAEPVGVLLSYALGADDEEFLRGLNEALCAFDTVLLGGDTFAAEGARTFGITAIGRATHRPPPARSGARPGHLVYVTGSLGRAMLGFEGDRNHLEAFNRPVARLEEGRVLAPIVSAMMDVSDGLLLDAYRLAAASEVTITLNTHSVPAASETRRDECLRWGDDYELLFTLPAYANCPIPATRIGAVETRGFALLMVDDHPIVNEEGLGFRHG